MADVRPCETLIEDFCCMGYMVSVHSVGCQKHKPIGKSILDKEEPWSRLSIFRIERLVPIMTLTNTVKSIKAQFYGQI